MLHNARAARDAALRALGLQPDYAPAREVLRGVFAELREWGGLAQLLYKARDSLLAPALAATLFRQVVETWPESPYAPKAMLAAGVLDPFWGEAMRPLLEER